MGALGLAAVVAGCLLASGQAAAGTVMTTRGGFVVDGRRYVAHPTGRGAVRIVDDAARRSFEVDRPAACDGTRPKLRTVAAGSGRVLAACAAPGGATAYAVLDVARRTWSEAVGVAAMLDRYDDSSGGGALIDGVGARWISVYAAGHHWQDRAWLDWRTGAALRSDGALRIADLDASQLFRRPCSPSLYSSVLRHPNSLDGNGAAPAYDARSRYELVYVEGVGLRAQRCGSDVVLPLEWRDREQVPWVQYTQIGAGAVTWLAIVNTNSDAVPQRWFARTHLLECAVRLSWEVPEDDSIDHTRRAVYLGRPSRPNEAIRRPLPRCADQPRPHRLTAVADGRRVAASLTTMHWRAGKLSGARVRSPEPPASAELRLRTGASVRLQLDAPATRVRWRSGSGRWRAADGRKRAWTLVPSPGRQRPRKLSVTVRYATGDRASFALTTAARADSGS